MRWGDFELHLISDGQVWLDGGAMFGVIPRTLWEKHTAPDEHNRISLGLNCLLVRTGNRNVLIDTGCGHKYTDKELRIYRIEHSTDVLSELARVGLGPEDIDVVINTHLHFDHCGGNTIRREGDVVPTFPRAVYIVRRQEYEDAVSPNERARASYFGHNWEPLARQRQLELVDEDSEVVPGITLVGTPGHTLGHQSIKIESGGKTLFYIGDLCPTAAHVPLPWIMAYDLYPMMTLETRKRIYEQACRQKWLILFEHEPRNPVGYLCFEEGRYTLESAAWED